MSGHPGQDLEGEPLPQHLSGEGEFVPPNRARRRAAGYVRQRKVFKLCFDDAELEGLEVRARGVPLGTLMELLGLASLVEGGTANLTAEQAEAIKGLFIGFAEVLVSWNLQAPVLDDNGNETGEVVDVPPNLEGLNSQDADFVFQVITAWMDAVAGVSAPLGQPSSDGKPSLEASLPMEPLSPSPGS